MGVRSDFKKMSVHAGPKQSPGFLLWHVSTSWRSSIEAVLKPLGLTHPQFVVLASAGWLTRNGELATQVMIGKMAGLDPNTNSQVIKGLEEKELIERTPSSDGRAKNVSLTIKGSQRLLQALPAVEKTDAHFFSILGKDDLQGMICTFQQLMESMK